MNPYNQYGQPDGGMPLPSPPIYQDQMQPVPYDPEPQPRKKSRGLKVVVALALLELLVILGLLVALAATTAQPKQPAAIQKTAPESQVPTAATALGVQQTSDAITQQLSSLSDNRDLPEDRLSDRNLGL